MTSASIYGSAPIDTQRQEIRLLHVLPGSWNMPLRTQIKTASLLDELHYKALSYVWGQENEKCEIFIDDSKLVIKPRLFTVLVRVRAHGGDQVQILWVDALCIDQNNTLERNHQVSLMHEIYSKCSLCYVWFGEVSRGGIQAQLDCDFKQCVDLTPKYSEAHSLKWNALVEWNQKKTFDFKILP